MAKQGSGDRSRNGCRPRVERAVRHVWIPSDLSLSCAWQRSDRELGAWKKCRIISVFLSTNYQMITIPIHVVILLSGFRRGMKPMLQIPASLQFVNQCNITYPADAFAESACRHR